MKFTLPILALVALSLKKATAEGTQPGGYQTIPYSPHDQQLTDSLGFGLPEAIDGAIKSGELVDAEWSLTEVNSVQYQVVDGTNYDFNVDISDGKGDTAVLDLVVNVESYEPDTLVSYSVKNEGRSLAGGSQTIPYDPNNQELVAILDFGLQEAIADAIGDGRLAEGNWSLDTVTNLQTQVVSGMNYDFNVLIGNGEGQTAGLDFVVYVVPWENSKTLISYQVLLKQ